MNSIFRIILYGIQGFRRNIWLSVIAIITLTMTLLTITTFAMGDMIAKKKYEEFNKQNIDYVVFMKDSASDADVEIFRNQVSAQPNVLKTDYLDKNQVKERFDELFGSEPDLKGIITDDNNPLPRELTVKFIDPKGIDTFDKFVQQDKFQAVVERTSYQNNKQVINNYVRITNFLKIFGISFTIFFLLIAILVVLNTIRLTIYSRREEIEIMRYVGATGGYIRGPFIMEGMLFGLISALFAALLSWLILTEVESLITQSFNVGTTNIITDLFGSTLGSGQSAISSVLWYLFILQVATGILLGVLCSTFAVRRYLKE